MRLVCLSLFSVCLVCVMSAQTPTPSSANSDTGIEGTISASPAHGGPVRVGVPNSRPLANSEFVVENANGTVTSFKTDDQGHFRIALAPGHYTVSLKQKKARIGRFGPFEADVIAGQMTKVQWMCDTGMR